MTKYLELSIIEKYLPEMLSEEEIKKIICAIINSSELEKIKSNFISKQKGHSLL